MRSGSSAAVSSTGVPSAGARRQRRARGADPGGAQARAAEPELGAHVPPDEIDELRIVSNYLASHPETTQLVL